MSSQVRVRVRASQASKETRPWNRHPWQPSSTATSTSGTSPTPSGAARPSATLWQEDASHLARTLEAVGHDGIETRVADAYEKWVKEKGNVFRLRDGVDGHHGTIKLRWEMLPAAGGEVISIGFDFLVLGDDGRIRTGYQFIEA